MLHLFRKHATSWLIKVALFAIVIVFIFWGGYSYQSRKANQLARVGDTFITFAEYDQAHDQLLEMYRRQFGDNFSPELARQLNLKQQALNLLIDRLVIAMAARELGLEATTEEVQREILEYPVFQKDGVFDQERYVFILQQNHMSPAMFEGRLAQDLMLRKVEDFVRRQAVVTEDEVTEDIRFNHSEIRLAHTTVRPEPVENLPSPGDAEVQAYFEQHKERYREPEKRRFAWVLFGVEDYLESVQVTDEEISLYYEDHPEEFHQDPQVRARHILFRVADTASEDEVNEIRAKALEVLEKAKGGEDFSQLALEHSQDPGSATRGGDLGYFTREQMIPTFGEAAFSLKPGEISDLVRTPYGFHIIKNEDMKPEKTTPLEEARPAIEARLKRNKAQDLAYEKALEFSDLASAEGDVVKAAASAAMEAAAPERWFVQGEPLPDVEASPEISRALFDLPEGGISRVLESESGYLVAQVKAVKASEIPALDAVKQRVVGDFKREKARQAAQQRAAELLKAARVAGSLEAAASEENLVIEKTDWFSRKRFDPKLLLRPNDRDEVFSLSEAHRFPEAPLAVDGGFVVCELLEARPPSEEVFAKEREATRRRLMAQKQAQLWQAWLEDRRAKANVEILQEL
jgi:peptidyl-prolyl cis-trans isomerase D